MKFHFLGANRQVTGSRHFIEVGGLRILVDCGMFQERAFSSRNWNECPIKASSIDVLLLTHAHLDHCGLIPKLVKDGFKGAIVTTPPTVELAEIIMRDSAKIQEEDAAYKLKRHRKEKRKGPYEVKPLYTVEDVDPVMQLFRQVKYDQPHKLNDKVTVTYHNAGHILGSAVLSIRARVDGGEKTIVFSGDLGQHDKPFICDPEPLNEADVLIMESTYGDRDHPDFGDIESQLEKVINETIPQGGNVIIPTFAVERAQELVFHVGNLVRGNRIPDVPVYLDSPMAVNATEVFKRHRQYCDEQTAKVFEEGNNPLQFDGFKMARSVKDSIAINSLKSPAVIMASSGMCTGGRIKHHLRQNITRRECSLLFVGYQAVGTLGRQIVSGKEVVRIHGREWLVRAKVRQIQGMSAHADLKGMLEWMSNFKTPPKHTFLVHGEENAALHMADTVRDELGWENVTVPEYEQQVTLEGL